MNSNRRVLVFILSSVAIYLCISILAFTLDLQWAPLKKINLISDLLKARAVKPLVRDTLLNVPPIVIEKSPGKDFNLYIRPNYITNFNADTTQPAMTGFLKKLDELKKKKRKKLRIAYFGDSMIEGDLLTQTLRKLLQKEFGGSGVGFVPVTSQVSKFRQTVTDNYSGGWKDENFRTGSKNNLFFSGHVFTSQGDWVEMKDQTVPDTITLGKHLLCGQADSAISITVNNKPFALTAKDNFNRVLISNDKGRNIKLSVDDARLQVYGISFESEEGIILDNFSFRGISGIELNKLDTAFLESIKRSDSGYDLLIFQYGVNVLFRPGDLNFNWYGKMFSPVIKKIGHCFNNADLIIISTADRAFRYDGEYKSAIGIDSLIKVQAEIAYNNGCNFYNQFETMGGHNSIVKWATQDPSLANKDYVHPNLRGAEILGNDFFAAIMKDYNKYLLTLK